MSWNGRWRWGTVTSDGRAEDARSRRRIGLHPLLVAALRPARDEMRMIGLYDPEGFVFCTRERTPMTMSNLRHAFRRSASEPGWDRNWTTYELRHSFVSLVATNSMIW